MGGRYSNSNTDLNSKSIDIVPGGNTDTNIDNTKNSNIIVSNNNTILLNYNNNHNNNQVYKKIGDDLVKKTNIVSNINYIAKITTFDLNKCFHSNAIDNSYLNKECFNKSIKLLLGHLNLPSIAYTHLSDKLFDMVDTSGDGRISKDEFLRGMTVVLGDNENGKKCKF
jgi:hypothetical protein